MFSTRERERERSPSWLTLKHFISKPLILNIAEYQLLSIINWIWNKIFRRYKGGAVCEYPALPAIHKKRSRTSTAPSSLCSNSSRVGIHAAIAMTFSIVHEIPSAPRPAKEKHVPFLSVKQPGSGGRRQTMPGHYRLPGLLARHSLFVLTPASEFSCLRSCACVRVRACDPRVCSFPPRSRALDGLNARG